MNRWFVTDEGLIDMDEVESVRIVKLNSLWGATYKLEIKNGIRTHRCYKRYTLEGIRMIERSMLDYISRYKQYQQSHSSMEAEK